MQALYLIVRFNFCKLLIRHASLKVIWKNIAYTRKNVDG